MCEEYDTLRLMVNMDVVCFGSWAKGFCNLG